MFTTLGRVTYIDLLSKVKCSENQNSESSMLLKVIYEFLSTFLRESLYNISPYNVTLQLLVSENSAK